MQLTTFARASFVCTLLLLLSIVTNAQSGSCFGFDFNLAPNFAAGGTNGAFASGDFNGDGKLDLVSTDEGQSSIFLLLGDGAGGFGPPRKFPAGLNPKSITSGDYNSDGKLDVFVGAIQNKIGVILNDGNGGFQVPLVSTPPITSGQFWVLKSADLNGDGFMDVAAGLPQADPNVLIFLGNGLGNFTLAGAFSSGLGVGVPRMAIGDINNDGRPDVLVSQKLSFGNSLHYVPGTSGAFSLVPLATPPEEVLGLTVAEVNNDGKNDLAIATSSGVRFWVNNNNNGFIFGNLVTTPYFSPTDVVSADFNGDGIVDIAAPMGTAEVMVAYGRVTGALQDQTFWTTPNVGGTLLAVDVDQDSRKDLLFFAANSGPGLITTLLNDNNAGFKAPKPIAYGGTDIVAADFNNDQLLDMVTVTDTIFSTTSQVVIADNDGNRGLRPDTNWDTPAALQAFAVGDFNHDGNKDAVTAHSYSTKQIAVELGNGTGSVGTPVTTNWPAEVVNVVAGDFNGDLNDDVFIIDGPLKGYVLLGLGNGTFNPNPTFTITLGANITPHVADINHDGKKDLLTFSPTAMFVSLGVGDGTFTTGAPVPLATEINAAGDLNGDGHVDVVSLKKDGFTINITRLFGDGTGGFTAGTNQAIDNSTDAYSVVAADFNGDGLSDIAYSSNQTRNNLTVIPSTNQPPLWSAPISYSVGGMTGYFSALAAGDYDHDGKIDIAYTHLTMRGVIYNKSGSGPCVSVTGVNYAEGDSGPSNASVTVTLSAPSTKIVRVNYSLTGVTATAGTDYQEVSGRLEIAPGQTSAEITVPIQGDLVDEFDETLQVNLASPANAAIQNGQAVITIFDNDEPPSLVVNDVSKLESSVGGMQFQVTLSGPSEKPISFQYATADGTALAGSDYESETGTINVPLRGVAGGFSVTIIDDQMFELDETFVVNLSNPVNASIADTQGVGTITNNDTVPVLRIFQGGFNEGDFGITQVPIVATLSNPTYLPVTLNYATSDGTATAGRDYVAGSGPLSIPSGQTQLSIPLQIIGDTINEPSESINVTLSSVSNATGGMLSAQFFIGDDENVISDFDRDGRTDLAVFRPSDKTWYVLRSQTNTTTATPYGLGTDIPVSGDYNGDGRTDIGVWRPSNGTWYTPIANRSAQWGQNGDIPVAGDYDNDGLLDVGVFRPSDGTWYISRSSNGSNLFIQWGIATDIPAPADFDGDGKTDIAVFRPGTGIWYVLRSRDGGITSIQWGAAGDKPVASDYDGDGRADIAVWRPADGNWYILRSGDNGITATHWGQNGDKPVTGNYDGDDRSDIAVYRDGAWYILLSSDGSLLIKQFGLTDDIPIPSVSPN